MLSLTNTRLVQLRLKHRFVEPPADRYILTSREYGAGSKMLNASEDRKNGSQTERPIAASKEGLLPRIKSAGYTGYHNPDNMRNDYWKQHAVGVNPPSPRSTQRSTAQDSNTCYSRALQENTPRVGKQIQGLSGLPQGYSGHRARFRYCTNSDRNGDVGALTAR